MSTACAASADHRVECGYNPARDRALQQVAEVSDIGRPADLRKKTLSVGGVEKIGPTQEPMKASRRGDLTRADTHLVVLPVGGRKVGRRAAEPHTHEVRSGC